MEMLPKNIELVKNISAKIKQYSPDAIIITATNPVDPLNYATWLSSGFDRKKVIGYTINDSFRFREMLAKSYNVKVSQVDGLVIGEHGSTQVYLFSTATINGKNINITEDIKFNIRSEIPNILKRLEELKSGRTAGWTCAVGLEKMVRAIVENTGEILPCSVMLNGEYGADGISMSVPARLGKNGVMEILDYDLAPDEMEGLKKTVSILKKAAVIVDNRL
jgi:malate dehydrogenase